MANFHNTMSGYASVCLERHAALTARRNYYFVIINQDDSPMFELEFGAHAKPATEKVTTTCLNEWHFIYYYTMCT